MKILTLLLSLSLVQQAFAGGDVLSVGTDQDCDYNDIQSAINAGNELSIHITTQQVFREHLQIADADLVIKGGYSDCEQAENGLPGNLKTVISGDLDDDDFGDGTVLSVTGTGVVYLDHLKLTEGDGGDFSGGLSVNDFAGTITLNRLVIDQNRAFYGGGVGVHDSPGAQLLLGDSVLIINNRANFAGGGLYCNDESIIRSAHSATGSGISNNTVALSGGGLFLGNGCEMTFGNGRIEPGFLDFRGIAGNQAGMHGGGAFISNGAKLFLTPVAGQTVNLSDNVADANDSGHGHGGGAYVNGQDSLLAVTNSYVAVNQAVDGGGVYVRNGGEFTSNSTAQGCLNQQRCAYIKSNVAENKGGAVYADHDGQVTLLRTAVEYNQADFGTAFYGDNNAEASVDFSLFSRNGGSGLLDMGVFQLHGDASLDLTQSTVVDNHADTAVFITGMTPFDLGIHNSIVHDPSSGLAVDLAAQQAANLFVWCSMFHEDDNGLYGDDVVVDDPHFTDRMARDFSLDHELSTAIDACFQWSNHDQDYLGAPAGWDDPNVIGSGGGYDMGAMESYGADVIFKDGLDD